MPTIQILSCLYNAAGFLASQLEFKDMNLWDAECGYVHTPHPQMLSVTKHDSFAIDRPEGWDLKHSRSFNLVKLSTCHSHHLYVGTLRSGGMLCQYFQNRRFIRRCWKYTANCIVRWMQLATVSSALDFILCNSTSGVVASSRCSPWWYGKLAIRIKTKNWKWSYTLT